MDQNNRREQLHLRDYLDILSKRRWIILATFLVVVVAAGVGSFYVRPQYRAVARLQIEKEGARVVDIEDVLGLDTSSDYYQTQYNILQSRSLVRNVVQELDLPASTEFAPPEDLEASPLRRARGWLRALFSGLEQGREARPWSELGPEERERRTIEEFEKRLGISPLRGTRLVDVSLVGYDPVEASRIVNALTQEYIRQDFERRFEASQQAVNWLNERVGEMRGKVEASALALNRFKEQHQIISFEEKQNIVVQKLAELNTAVTVAKTERIALETLYQKVSDLSADDPTTIEAVSAVINNPLILTLKTDLVNLLRQRSDISKRYREKHPKMVAIDSEIEVLTNRLRLEITKIVESIATDYEVALAKERTLARALEAQKQEALELNAKAIEYGSLEADVETNKQLFEVLLSRMKETSLTSGLATGNISVVDAAEPPDKPFRPRKKMNLALGALIGLLLGIGLAFLAESMDNTIRSPEQVEQALQITYLGTVPRFATDVRGGVHLLGEEAVVFNDPQSHVAEAVRNLRTNLLFTTSQAPHRRVMVTSAQPHEGKTTVAVNLAISLAQLNRKVLLVDADMRKPRLHVTLNLKNERGLSSLIIGEGDLADSVQTVDNLPHLHVITAGPAPPNPAELIDSPGFDALVADTASMYDFVLFDTPPMFSVTDALVLGTKVDGVLLVIKGGDTPVPPLRRGLQQLRQINCRLLGAVINNIDLRRGGYYYKHYYGYSDSYYGYGRSDRTSRRT